MGREWLVPIRPAVYPLSARLRSSPSPAPLSQNDRVSSPAEAAVGRDAGEPLLFPRARRAQGRRAALPACGRAR